MSAPHRSVRMSREHLLPALETAFASWLVSTMSPAFVGTCRPTANRLTRCAVTAIAVVADPGVTVEVLDYVRALVFRTDSAGVPKPVLTEITGDGPALVTVNYLRN